MRNFNLRQIGVLIVAVLCQVAPVRAALDLLPWIQKDPRLWQRTTDQILDGILIPGQFLSGNPLRSTECRLGAMPLDETLIFVDDHARVTGFQFSVINRGDTRNLSLEKQDEIRLAAKEMIAKWVGSEGSPETSERMQAAVLSQQIWKATDREITLSWSVSRRHKEKTTDTIIPERAEYVRIDIKPVAPPSQTATPGSAPGIRPDTAADRARAKPLLTQRVKRQPNGDVVILDVPMVDQGDKGYCVAATISRMLKYYGLDVDQHEIAQLANASPSMGTRTDELMEALRRSGTKLGITSRTCISMNYQDYSRLMESYNRLAKRYKKKPASSGYAGASDLFTSLDSEVLGEVRLDQRNDYRKFLTTIRSSIDSGVPLAWSLVLGKVAEEGATPQTSGGHMRLIIGYNDKLNELIFSDSWGAGHEAKRIRMNDAWTVTTGLFIIEPRAAS